MKAIKVMPGWYAVVWMQVVNKHPIYRSFMVKAKSKHDAVMALVDQQIKEQA